MEPDFFKFSGSDHAYHSNDPLVRHPICLRRRSRGDRHGDRLLGIPFSIGPRSWIITNKFPRHINRDQGGRTIETDFPLFQTRPRPFGRTHSVTLVTIGFDSRSILSFRSQGAFRC